MPDQSSASNEHALMQEITAPLATLPDDPVPVVADVDFPLVLRGYDRVAVDAYVRKTSQLVAELQATRSPDAAIRRALERVGAEVSSILQRAHETAEEITAQSRTDAEDRLEVARREAAQVTAEAEARLKELDAETDRIWEERHRIVEDTRQLAGQLLALADSAASRFPAEEAPPQSTSEGAEAGWSPISRGVAGSFFPEEKLEDREMDAGEPDLERAPRPGAAAAREPLVGAADAYRQAGDSDEAAGPGAAEGTEQPADDPTIILPPAQHRADEPN